MRRWADARRGPSVAHSEHAASVSAPGPGASSGNKRPCERGVQKIVDTVSFNGPRIPGGVIAQLSAPQIRVEPGGHLRITLAEARRGLNKQRQEPTPTPPRGNPKTTGCAFLRCNVRSLYGSSHDSSLERAVSSEPVSLECRSVTQISTGKDRRRHRVAEAGVLAVAAWGTGPLQRSSEKNLV